MNHALEIEVHDLRCILVYVFGDLIRIMRGRARHGEIRGGFGDLIMRGRVDMAK